MDTTLKIITIKSLHDRSIIIYNLENINEKYYNKDFVSKWKIT